MRKLLLVCFFLACLFQASSSFAGLRGASVLALLDVQKINGDVRYKSNETCQERFAKQLRNEGFTAVRLVIAPVPLLQSSSSGRSTAVSQIAECGAAYKLHNMTVVYDITQDTRNWSKISDKSPFSTLISDDFFSIYRRGLIELVMVIAKFNNKLDVVELLNEPPTCEKEGDINWEEIQKKLYVGIRSRAPDLGLLFSPCGGQLHQLAEFDGAYFASDTRVYVSFHFYEPYTFTHQFGNQGIKFNRVPYPPDLYDFGEVMLAADEQIERDASDKPLAFRLRAAGYIASYLQSGVGREAIQKRISSARDWAERYSISPDRLMMGEFGAGIHFTSKDVSPDIIRGQLRWLEDVSMAAEKNGISWFFWFYPQRTRYWWDHENGGLKSEWRNALIRSR